jgi:hypothetical protein
MSYKKTHLVYSFVFKLHYLGSQWKCCYLIRTNCLAQKCIEPRYFDSVSPCRTGSNHLTQTHWLRLAVSALFSEKVRWNPAITEKSYCWLVVRFVSASHCYMCNTSSSRLNWYLMCREVMWANYEAVTNIFMNYKYNNQHDTLFILSLLNYHTSTCFRHINSPYIRR